MKMCGREKIKNCDHTDRRQTLKAPDKLKKYNPTSKPGGQTDTDVIVSIRGALNLMI